MKTLRLRNKKHLLYLLGLSKRQLEAILEEPERFYHPPWRLGQGSSTRTIRPPKPLLMKALRKLNARLQLIELPDYMQGGLKRRSNISNANRHTAQPAILKADIRKFFPSVSFDRVYEIFREKLKCSSEVSEILATLCTIDNQLPQGAPTSTTLANLAVEHLAFRLNGLAQAHGAVYTQFVDDITISGPRHLNKLEKTVNRIIEQEGFVSHPGKLKTIFSTEEQVVTGVRVNKGKDVESEKLLEARRILEELRSRTEEGISPSEKELSSISGKIDYISGLNRGIGKSLKRRLHSIRRTSPPSFPS